MLGSEGYAEQRGPHAARNITWFDHFSHIWLCLITIFFFRLEMIASILPSPYYNVMIGWGHFSSPN